MEALPQVRNLMLKINCPECLKEFMWTDHMPTKGKCPTPDCEWRYDVQQELKKGVEKHAAGTGPACPRCGAALESRFCYCLNCRELVIGPVSVSRNVLLSAAIAILITIFLLYPNFNTG